MLFIISVFTMKVNIKRVKLTLRRISHYNNALRSLGESMEYLKIFLEEPFCLKRVGSRKIII
jgi:hypothetical protein